MNAPRSNLPPAARRQVKAANAAAAAFAAGQPLPPGSPPQPAPLANAPQNEPQLPSIDLAPPTQFTPASPPVQHAPQSNAVPVQPTGPANPAPGPSAAAQPVAPPQDDWEQRYKVLQGKYTAEMGEMRRNIAQQQDMIDRILRQPPAAAPAPVPAAPPPAPTLEQRAKAVGVTEQQLKEFGPDLAEMMLNIAENSAARQVAPVAQQMGQVAQAANAAQTQIARSSQELVWQALRRAFPDGEADLINGSQEFVDWINSADIFSGQARHVGLFSAFRAGDADRVVSIFRAFKVEEDARRQATAAAPAREAQVDPATLLAPGAPRGQGSAAPATANSGRIWSESEIRDFYARVQRGRISAEERTATEADIHQALREGRIAPEHPTRHLLNNG